MNVWFVLIASALIVPTVWAVWRERCDLNQPDPRLARAARIEALRQQALEADRS